MSNAWIHYAAAVYYASSARMREQARREGRPLDTGETVGIKLFRNGVEYIRDHF